MKICLEPTRLCDIAGGHADPEGEAHVRGCSSCRTSLQLLRLIPEAVAARDVAVPDHLNALTMRRITALAESEARASRWQAVVTGVLGAVACALTLVVTGGAGLAGLSDFLVFSGAVGMISGIVAGWPGTREGGRRDARMAS